LLTLDEFRDRCLATHGNDALDPSTLLNLRIQLGRLVATFGAGPASTARRGFGTGPRASTGSRLCSGLKDVGHETLRVLSTIEGGKASDPRAWSGP
jgi:hypothetical protein